MRSFVRSFGSRTQLASEDEDDEEEEEEQREHLHDAFILGSHDSQKSTRWRCKTLQEGGQERERSRPVLYLFNSLMGL